MLKVRLGLMAFLPLISGLSLASNFSLDKKVAQECFRQGNYQNFETIKSFCHVTNSQVEEVVSFTIETFAGDCGVTMSQLENNKVELQFYKNPNRYNFSTHLEVKEAKKCLANLIEESERLF